MSLYTASKFSYTLLRQALFQILRNENMWEASVKVIVRLPAWLPYLLKFGPLDEEDERPPDADWILCLCSCVVIISQLPATFHSLRYTHYQILLYLKCKVISTWTIFHGHKTAAFILALLIPFSSDPFDLPIFIRLLHPPGPSTLLCSGLRFPETALVLPQNCRLFWCFPKIAGWFGASPRLPAALDLASVGCVSAWAAISSSNTSPQPNRALLPLPVLYH